MLPRPAGPSISGLGGSGHCSQLPHHLRHPQMLAGQASGPCAHGRVSGPSGPHPPVPAGSLSHSECSTPPQSPLSVEGLSSCSQSQTSAATLPRIAVNPAALGERRKDR